MSHVEQVRCEPLWVLSAFALDPEPFAYIAEWAGSFRVDDIADGPLGSRRTLAEAVALADQHSASVAGEEAARTARINAIIAAENAALTTQGGSPAATKN